MSVTKLKLANPEEEVISVEQNGVFEFSLEQEGVRITVNWIAKQQGVVGDLDITALVFDERARYSERIDSQCRESKDASLFLTKDFDPNEPSKPVGDVLKVDFRCVKSSTSAIIIYLDGGPRNFQYLQSVTVVCSRVKQEKTFGGFLPQHDRDGSKSGPLFSMTARARKTYKGLVVCALYKDGWNEALQRPCWVAKSFMEPVFVSSLKEKQDMCTQLVINSVPALEKFRLRLFASVRDISAALSSHALPKLKKKFQKSEEGLPIGQFTDVIFKQLFETFPKIVDESEAAYTVAMLQEMFHQIDYNGDGSCNWDEFTSFCVQTGLTTGNKRGANTSFSLEQYVIEYGEEVLQRDHILSPYRFVSVMRHVPEIRRLLIISEDSDYVLILDEKFRTHAQLYPSKVQVIGAASHGHGSSSSGNGTSSSSTNKSDRDSKNAAKKAAVRVPNNLRAMIYDIVYLTGRDMFAYTSSDHSITVCRELSSMEGMKVNYIQHNRFYHTLLHLKLCWSAKHEILCSVASDKVIYGWNIDTSQILFQISRHSDIITDFIAVDSLDVFVTCSMDMRIVMWSATSRRVKGVLLRHKRGVRCLSVFEHSLLSAGFECEANLWDLVNKDCVAVLKGHRHPIVAAKLMCDRAQSEREHRAITVDESGEFRLWNIYVRERASDPVPVPTIQIFEMQNAEHPLNQFRFLALPFNPQLSTSYYSNLIACSTKLLHFLPEKNMKEFVPPTACAINEAAALIVTAVGKSILSYDLAYGEFTNIFENIVANDVFALCMDGDRGRRIYIGTAKGDLLLINTITGQLIDQVNFHTKEITAIVQRSDLPSCIYSIGMDGHLRMYDENGGKIHMQNSSENVIGVNVGLAKIKHVPTLHVLVIAAAGKSWTIINDSTLKKLGVFFEEDVVTGIEIIGASRDKEEEQMISKAQITQLLSKKNTSSAALLGKLSRAVSRSTMLTSGSKLNGLRSPLLDSATKSATATTAGAETATDTNAASSTGGVSSSSLYEPPSLKENLLTVAVALSRKVHIYTIDVHGMKGLRTYELIQELSNAYLTDICMVRSPDIKSVNYAFLRARNATSAGSQLVASSDDGKLLIWDSDTGDSLRVHCESKYRTHMKYVAQMKRTHKGRRELEQKEKDARHKKDRNNSDAAAATTTTSKADDTADSHFFLTVHDDNNAKPPMLSSSTGALETATAERKGSDENRRLISTAGTQASTASNNTRPGSPELVVKTWIETPANEFFPVALTGKARKAVTPAQEILLRTTLHPMRLWTGHNDLIPFLVPLTTHSCVATVSHDGYHRVWNLDGECLGEMILPNITEHMKSWSMCKDPGTQWRFILERLPVTKYHQDVAATLVRQLKQSRQDRMLEQQQLMLSSDRRNMIVGITGIKELLAIDDLGVGEAADRARLRENVLKSLNEPPAISEDVPPSRLPTKEEKELMKLSLMTNNQLSLSQSLTEDSLNANSTELLNAPSSVLDLPSPSMARSQSMKHSHSQGNMRKLSPLHSPSRSKVDHLQDSKTRSSLLFGGDSSVCMSCFGVPSLWTVPGEKDIFGNSITTSTNNNMPEYSIPAAFSEQSINSMQREGLIDQEGRRILRRIAMNPDRVQVYDRSQPTLLVRSPMLSTSIELPQLEQVRRTEINFGMQKDMYKNAEKMLNARNNLSKNSVRSAVTLTRIDQNVRKIQSMIHLIQPPSHDEVILPKSSELDNDHSHGFSSSSKPGQEDHRMQIRLLKSAAAVPLEAKDNERPLDRDSLSRWAGKMQTALDVAPDMRSKTTAVFSGKSKKKKESLTQAMLLALERKLQQAIKGEYRSRMQALQQHASGANGNKPHGDGTNLDDEHNDNNNDLVSLSSNEANKPTANPESRKLLTLTTRQLLPYYKLETVHQFMDIFAKVDENFSGDLDVNEWIKLFSSLNESVTEQEARMIFLKIDADNDGFLSMRELIPVVFNKASKDQMKLIIEYAEQELTKKVDCEQVPKVTNTDLEFLFESYDSENLGFVDVALIKERIRRMRMPEQALFFFMETISDLADDEMVNLVEFKRLFKAYTKKK